MEEKTKYTVLVVEDDPMVLLINSEFVNKHPLFTVAGSCKNGTEALQFLKEHEIDLVLLDVYMPGITGTETLKKLRETPSGTDVIMVTAANDSQTIEEAVRLGVVDYLVKPFTQERLFVALEKYARNRAVLSKNKIMDQGSIDRMFLGSTTEQDATAGAEEALPKGIQKKTLERMRGYFNAHFGWISVDGISEELGISAVTARLYVNYLVKTHYVTEDINYETGGRPSMLYKKTDK